ncbi:ATP-dependent RNA helicase SUPV3L1/SUV3 [Sphingomonas laterariae]|uniref:ATP-dependent RNA helicase SUPV3L1/SUV3 n=1 Tax=Edaphosphingomonas laterariae TaxID=861865 RepID=A0A239HR03_9SPHN|nr:helicase-related protein [Sphingomonas laterariae]SNS82724.1 ATP-dependent RNA helicase SUPV3L1/SUV3 [Sphingomonas laterariae]
MSRFAASPIAAVLGPTNTGKTHLAIERMCGHSSGMIGFPLRLLAREVYERVVAIKGRERVALITGEEKILPDHARWFCCTAESMPMEREFAFVALDEAQLGADPERGHVFTDRLLRARGRDETMILGSETLRPMLRALVPDAEIINRPRFSTLTYAGPAKLSRLPPRSAIVAFSAEEVYAVAEALRRLRGGAAVVMGALSPRTRNAQVAMFQAGEVDYLVATDAIGMGLNMDVAHVAFASLKKFDGKRSRRLTVSEMAQIAGRAGRHQRDGTFGTLAVEGGRGGFDEEEVEAIEQHRFPPLDFLYWREGAPDFSSVDALIASLEKRPQAQVLRMAPQAIDLAVLKRLAEEAWVRERTRGTRLVQRLWAACGLPDFRKTGAEPHGRFVARIYRHLSEGNGHIPAQWFADEIARLDSVQGDVETLADRIAAARTWAYIAHRADWLDDPAKWAERTRTLEEKLSDALHQRLTQRFVDRRTAVLMRDLGARGVDALPVTVAEDGAVAVDGETIGRLEGFRFKADHLARHHDMKRMMAAAERRLGGELSRRAKALVADGDPAFSLDTDAGRPVAIFWRGDIVGRLARGRDLLTPKITLYKALDALAPDERKAVADRLAAWIAFEVDRVLKPLAAISNAARDKTVPPALRGLYAPLAEAGGIADRRTLEPAIAAIDREMRQAAAKTGLKLGTLDVYFPALLKPEPVRWRLALAAAFDNGVMPALPPAGAATLATPADGDAFAAFVRAGYRPLGAQMLRVDLAERLARIAHDRRIGASDSGRAAFAPDPALATSLGLRPPSFAQLMLALGFRPAEGDGDARARWAWRGARRPRRREPARPGNAFAALAAIRADE